MLICQMTLIGLWLEISTSSDGQMTETSQELTCPKSFISMLLLVASAYATLDPLLERLDCFLTSNSWTNHYPGTTISTLYRDTSDHVPYLVNITTENPKGRIFRFENYWAEHINLLRLWPMVGPSPPTFQTKQTTWGPNSKT
jgi:hypothetical protein